MQKDQEKPQDAGMRSLRHYQVRLPQWRFALREYLLPIVRGETPYLAKFQERLRTSALDSYFVLTANLASHTFFMIILPILWWCGYSRLGRAMVHMLASGVYFSGFVKDLLCLPRPLSPPLERISPSISAALEYGFPSTHSTNAVSVAFFAIHAQSESSNLEYTYWSWVIGFVFYFYALSTVTGRVYCGMHGFFDVIIGSLLGASIAVVQIYLGDVFDEWIINGSYWNTLITTLAILFLVRVHPEPVDDCPCYDDSVAFSGVMIGTQLGAWHIQQTGYNTGELYPTDSLFSFKDLGLANTALRIVVGVAVIFVWRGVMKSILLKLLPPLFRVIENMGLTLPRRFHLQASEYQIVPPLMKDDMVIPSASEIPAMITSLRHSRHRTVSIGPQSQADAYEAIALRERRRRESASPVPPRGSSPGQVSLGPPDDLSRVTTETEPFPPFDQTLAIEADFDGEEFIDHEIFEKLQVPRVRYDVEVVTKLIVYAGIAWLATEGNPILFEFLGLGGKPSLSS